MGLHPSGQSKPEAYGVLLHLFRKTFKKAMRSACLEVLPSPFFPSFSFRPPFPVSPEAAGHCRPKAIFWEVELGHVLTVLLCSRDSVASNTLSVRTLETRRGYPPRHPRHGGRFVGRSSLGGTCLFVFAVLVLKFSAAGGLQPSFCNQGCPPCSTESREYCNRAERR